MGWAAGGALEEGWDGQLVVPCRRAGQSSGGALQEGWAEQLVCGRSVGRRPSKVPQRSEAAGLEGVLASEQASKEV